MDYLIFGQKDEDACHVKCRAIHDADESYNKTLKKIFTEQTTQTEQEVEV